MFQLFMAGFAAIWLEGCSISPDVADGGGTHTGNPDISACASSIFAILENDGAWKTQKFVSEDLLDPSSIEPGNEPDGVYSSAMAKTAFKADSATEERILLFDTLYMSDTLVVSRTETDTVETESSEGNLLYLETRLIYDTLIALDTLVVVDTLVVTKNNPDSTSDLAPDEEYAFSADRSTLEAPSFSSPDSSAVILANSSFPFAVSKSGSYTTGAGVLVKLQYTDADGDNLLFSASQGAALQVMLNGSRVSGLSSIFLKTVFSAGLDGAISTHEDNSVLSLDRISATGNDTTETAAFRAFSDSSVMTIEKFMFQDTVYSEKVRYKLNSNSVLSGITSYLMLRKGNSDRIFISCEPVLDNSEDTVISELSFEAVIVSDNSDTSGFYGSASLQYGIEAVYSAPDGAEYDVTVSENGQITTEKR
jgi:hypothetical protein